MGNLTCGYSLPTTTIGGSAKLPKSVVLLGSYDFSLQKVSVSFRYQQKRQFCATFKLKKWLEHGELT